MKKSAVIILCIILSVGLCGCGNVKTDKNTIAVSIVPQATFVEKVCGDKFDIVTMIPPGASAETYEPTIAEISQLENASIYFAIGVSAEKNIILPTIKDKEKIIELHTEAEKVYPPVEINGQRDPHLWLSPKRVIVMVKSIADALAKIDPENEDFYKTNALNYCNQLESTDKEIKQLLSNIKNPKFIAFHPAFGYFADDYSLTQFALEEDGKEADAKHLSKMIDLAKKDGIKVIFYQAELSDRQAQAFAEELGGKAVCLEPLSPDYTQNLLTMAKTLSEAMK